MRNILSIITGDFRRLFSSVVPIVILMGLCIIPCLFAWFNIVSNWDPFQAEATGNIPVAVVNKDDGSEMLGLYVNVGDKVTDAISGNDMINWQIMKSEKKAIEGTRAGDYYAAIVIPSNFSEDLMSFTSGDPVNPKLHYYENDKVNAVAPKITGQAKTALQEEVNAVFVGTIGKFISEAGKAADEAGVDPQDAFGNLSDEMRDLSWKLEDTVLLVEAAKGLSDSADELLSATGGMISGSEKTLKAGKKLLKAGEDALPDTKDTKPVSDAIKKEAKIIQTELEQLYADLSKIRDNMDDFNKFVEDDLQAKLNIVSKMQKSADKVASKLKSLGLTGLANRFAKLSQRLGKIYNKLASLQKADEESWPEIQKTLDMLLDDISTAEEKAAEISDMSDSKLDHKINGAVKDASKTISQVRKALSGIYGDLGTLDDSLAGASRSLSTLSGGMSKTLQTLASVQKGFLNLSDLFESLSDSDLLKDVNHLMVDDAEVIAERLASPIQMETVDIYPTRNFGSVMAGFYTAMALWMGALFSVVMMSVEIKRREGLPKLRLHERFFGRYRLFMTVGLIQALIVTLGDLLYLRIQCLHPVRFVLAACVISIAFTLIIYSLVFALGSVGEALCVIIMVLQVAGGGGTFPPEVTPPMFHVIFPFLPLHYAIDALRECISGMYDGDYYKYLGTLLLFAAIAVCFGLLMQKPLHKLIGMMEESMEESDLIA